MSKQDLAIALGLARAASVGWRTMPVVERLRCIEHVRRRLAADPHTLLDCFDWRRPAAETLAAEVLPLADAARFLVREARALLAPARPRGRRPLWLAGVRAELVREPWGVVLILAPGNYPLFLPGVQILQALAAGNAVCVKPAPGCAPPLHALGAMLRDGGLPDGALQILDDAHATGEAAARAGFDRIVLTGSAATGARVLEAAAATLTPCTMELSGNDPVFVLPDAALDLVADALVYGLRLNGGATCIGPRRVFATHGEAAALERALGERLARLSPVPIEAEAMDRLRPLLEAAAREGARFVARPPAEAGPIVLAGDGATIRRLTEDVFAPVLCLIPVADMTEALALAAESPYALGAAIFGPERAARALAARVNAGSVSINDLIVPTADPRLPFGGRGRSGFGVTRGAEGLLEMTVVKAVSVRRGRFRPHLASPDPGLEDRMRALIRVVHGTGSARIRALGRLLRA